MLILLMLIAFQIKHLIIDFVLQIPYHYLNKGAYGHFGGIEHALMHGIGTCIVLVFFTNPLLALGLALIDMVVHYHIDWAKMNINRIMNWMPNTSEYFWWLLGADQFLHQATYLALVALVVVYG